MDRRTLLKLAAAAALAGCGGRITGAERLRVVVAGAGIIGASIAYHLAKAGVSVTVIDQQGPATHASRGTFAWVNATWAKQPRFYHALNQQGLADWARIQQTLNIPVRWGGSLEWFDAADRQLRLADQIAEQVAWGEPARMINAQEFSGLEPHIHFPADTLAAWSPNDGALDPVFATQRLLQAATGLGADVRYPCSLEDVVISGDRLKAVETSQGSIPADRLVLATGAAENLPEKIAGIQIPQRSTPGVIAITKPMPRLLNRVIVAPGVHMHQRDDLRIVLGEQDGAPQNTAHAARLRDRPNEFPSPAMALQHSERMLRVAEQFVPQIAAAEFEATYIGWRPLPLDGHPVIGSSPIRPDVYLAMMHSGVSLAPIVGQLAAHELTAGMTIERLDQYRPGRDFANITRY